MAERIKKLGKDLRNRLTKAEQLLWNYLRMKQIEGIKFRRQQPIDNYIVDFVCFESRIIIEVDGGQHAENNKDRERDLYLQRNGFKVLRFWNNEVLQNINGVLAVIRENCLSHPPLNPLPSREGKVNKRFLPSREGNNRSESPYSREGINRKKESLPLDRVNSIPSPLTGEGEGGGEVKGGESYPLKMRRNPR